MKTQKGQFGCYETIAYLGEGNLRVSFVGFGQTINESMQKCFTKINNFLK